MKSVSTIIAIVLIMIILVALVSLFWLFASNLFTSMTQTGTASTTHMTESMSSCMKIESSVQNKIYLRNCGHGLITNNSLNIYLDDDPFGFNMTPSSINDGEIAIIALPIWGISIGSHRLKITNPKTELIKIAEASLPTSCVLALDFDEGSGTTTHDSSGNGNDGTLYNGTEVCSGGYCPTWLDGKFGKALQFDGIGDYVEVGNKPSLNFGLGNFTMEAWVKLSSYNYWKGIITKE